ncbi:MAG: hypothetical protein M9905_12155 [Rhizobiaceae bacterium]|nr:hypothetical protein [Rhizobiaceae bacterium]
MSAPAFRSAVTWIDQALACLAEAVERMPDDVFLAEHQASHDEGRSGPVDLIAGIYEREYWRRWPEGRDEEARP